GTAVRIQYGSNARIRNNDLTGGTYGVYIYGSSDAVISNNTVKSGSSGGVYVYQSGGAEVNSNTVINVGGSGANSSIVITSPTAVSGNRVINNKITDTAGTGYAILINANSTGTALSGNVY